VRFLGLFGWVLFIGVAVMLFMLLSKQGVTFKTIPFSEFMNIIEPGAGTNPSQAITSAVQSGGAGSAPAAAQQPQGAAQARPATGPSMSALAAAPAPAPAAASASAHPVIEWMTIEVDELTGKFAKKEQVAGQGIDFFKVTLPA